MESLGTRLRMYRKYRNMTQDELGKGICSGSAISQFERDVHCPSIQTLTLLAERLQFPIERLIYGEELERIQEKTFTAMSLYDNKQYDDAITLFEEIEKSPHFNFMPLKGHILYNLGNCYLEQGKFDAAIWTLSRIVDEAPESGLFVTDHILLSDAYFSLGKAFEGKALEKAYAKRSINGHTANEALKKPRSHLYLVKQ